MSNAFQRARWRNWLTQSVQHLPPQLVLIPIDFATRRPRTTVLLALLIVAVAAPGIGRLRLRTDGRALVPISAPVIQRDEQIRTRFGLRDQILVVVETSHGNGIFNPGSLRTVKELTDAISALPSIGPGHVVSLATERRDRVRDGEGTFQRFLDPIPATDSELVDLAADLRRSSAQSFIGTIVSADRTVAAILVGVPNDASARSAVLGHITHIARTVPTSASDRVTIVGAPVAEELFGVHIINDLMRIVPLTVAVIAVVVWIGCRRMWGVVLGMIEIGACLVFTFGVMGWLGTPIYLTTVVLPVVLVTVALTDEVHVFWNYQLMLENWHRNGSHEALVRRTMHTIARPLAISSVTTALGFLSFLGASIPPIVSFGKFAALGLCFCFVWSITFIPAALVLLSPSNFRGSRGKVSQRTIGNWAATALIRNRRAVLASVAVLTAAAALGVFGLHVQDGWIEGFAEQSSFRKATENANARLFGTHFLLIHIHSSVREEQPTYHAPQPILASGTLEAIIHFEDYVRTHPNVGGALGLGRHLQSLADFWLSARPGHPVDVSEDGIAQRLLERMESVDGVRNRRALIDDNYRGTVLTVFLQNANYQDTANLMRDMKREAERTLVPKGMNLEFCGDVAISQAMILEVVRSQLSALGVDIIVVGFIMFCFYRSVRATTLAVLPAITTIVWLFGLMGWLSIPLGVATSLFCVIVLSVGVDYAVYYLDAYYRAESCNLNAPTHRALTEVGPAILTDVIALAAGFGTLVVSQVPTNARLGMILAIGMVSGCWLTLAGLGSLLESLRQLRAPTVIDVPSEAALGLS